MSVTTKFSQDRGKLQKFKYATLLVGDPGYSSGDSRPEQSHIVFVTKTASSGRRSFADLRYVTGFGQARFQTERCRAVGQGLPASATNCKEETNEPEIQTEEDTPGVGGDIR